MTAPSPQELAATVRAGIARERQQAQEAATYALANRWESHYGDYGPYVSDPEDLHQIVQPAHPQLAAHIAAHDPARVLADCDRAEEDLAAWEAVLDEHDVDSCSSVECVFCLNDQDCPCRRRALAALARLAATYGGEG